MSLVIFQVKNGAPTSYTLKRYNVTATDPETGVLKNIDYFKGQSTIFKDEILEKNKNLKPTKVPEFVFNPMRNKCELRFDDSDQNLYKYLTTRSDFNVKYEIYSEDIENERKLGKAEKIEKALDYVKESDELKIRALGLAVIGLSSYNKPISSIKATLKDKAINKPKEIILACEDSLFENKLIASLAICSGIVKTNATMTAVVWADNNGRLLNIATGEDFITKFAQHISEKTPQSESLLQEIGKRLDLKKQMKESKSAEANEIAKLKAKLAATQEALEISQSKSKSPEPTEEEKEEASLKELAILEMRERYTEVTGKNLSIRFQNDMDWMEEKINEHLETQED